MSGPTYTPSTRLLVKARLMELVRNEVQAGVRNPETVQISNHPPGGRQHREAIFAVGMVGARPADRLSGGVDQKTSDDFTITVFCEAGLPGMTADMAEQRVDELAKAIYRVVGKAEYESTLGDFTLDSGHKPITVVELGQVDGPIVDPAGDEGPVGLIEIGVHVITNEVAP